MLKAGTPLGPYAVLDPLGSGGMGDVYRARDTRLNREVALKILPDRFALDANRMSRFRREAQLLASLNHPNIASIYGVEEENGRSALVLELVDGETLAERIARGPVRIEDAVKIALQIAEALEAAHEKSIIHRDLKPANVKITSQGIVKVLDFGLAKALEDNAAEASHVSQSPTMSAAATAAGIIMGTAGYMAPEQARGKQADRRSDIWAFGVILFEMLTAQRAFEGETVSDILAKILEREPDWHRLPHNLPGDIQKLLRHCLTKNPKDRLQAIGDARTLLQELVANPKLLKGEPQSATYPGWKKLLPWVVAPVMFAAAWVLKPSPIRQDAAVSRFEYVLPNGQNLMHGYRHGLDLSPDGSQMAFIAGSLAGEGVIFRDPGARAPRAIYVKRLDQWEATLVPGTESAVNVFFSPDGQSIGFFADGQLKKVALKGGAPVVLLEKTTLPFGVTWGKTGSIVFAPDVGGGLKIIPETGGEADNFTQLDRNSNEVSHRLPHFLPDGSGVLYTVLQYAYGSPDWKRAQIWATSLRTRERKLVIENATDARYIGNNRLVFARQGKLFAVSFDPQTLSASGSPVPVLDALTHAVAGIGVLTTSGAGQFSASENGSLLYAPGSVEPVLENSIVWVNRQGNITPLGTKPMSHGSVRISADGKRLAVTEYYVERALWVYDTARETQERQTSDGQSSDGVWSPDGSRLVFRSNSSGPMRLYSKSINSPDVVPLTPGPMDYSGAFTLDGKELIFVHGEAGTTSQTYDLHVVSMDQPNKPRPLLNTKFSETHPALSIDGKWLAYCSDESGRNEVYVQPYPELGRRITISTGGGVEPVFSRDGKELFYRQGQTFMSVLFKISGTDFVPEKPAVLFTGTFLGTTPTRMYDVAPDGRFLMIQPIPEKTLGRNARIFPPTLRVILNWAQEVESLAR
jgi:serine/threonine-protein kinase